MTVATGDGAPETRTEPALSAPAARRRRSGRWRSPTAGSTPAWRAVSITGVPRADLPAESKGYAVTRSVYRPDGGGRGSEQGAANRSVRRRDQGNADRRVAIGSDPRCRSAAGRLRDRDRDRVERALHDGLFLAARTHRRDLHRSSATTALSPPSTSKSGARDFTLAYVVRAVTPGEFTYPALVVEDMYEPETTGRTAIGKLTVCARVSCSRTSTRSLLRPRVGERRVTAVLCRPDGVNHGRRGLPRPAAAVAWSAAATLRCWSLAADGSILRGFLTADGKWRLPVEPEAVDPLYRRMLVAAEDRRFALAPRRRSDRRVACLGQLAVSGHVVSGASTLTMQAVRLLEPHPRSLSRQAGRDGQGAGPRTLDIQETRCWAST